MSSEVRHLVERRDLDVPERDAEPLAVYWAHLRQLREAVDETLLADHEIAVTWKASAGDD